MGRSFKSINWIKCVEMQKELILPQHCLPSLLWHQGSPLASGEAQDCLKENQKLHPVFFRVIMSKLSSTCGNPEVSTPGYGEYSRATSWCPTELQEQQEKQGPRAQHLLELLGWSTRSRSRKCWCATNLTVLRSVTTFLPRTEKSSLKELCKRTLESSMPGYEAKKMDTRFTQCFICV